MKAVIIAVTLLLLNISMSTITGSNLFTSPGYYENRVVETYDIYGNFTNMTRTVAEDQTIDIFTIIFKTLTFDWVNQYLRPIGLEEDLAPFITGLNTLLLLLQGIAFVELFMKRNDMLRGG